MMNTSTDESTPTMLKRRPKHLDRYMTTSDLCERYGRSVRTLTRWQETRGFPQPMIQGGGGTEHRWLAQDVMEWEESLRRPARREGSRA